MLTAIVTGASSGIGKDISAKLITSGYKVIGISRSKPPLEDIDWIKADLSNQIDIEEALEEVKNKTKEINLLVNNAAVMKTNKISNINFNDISTSFTLNVCTPLFLTSSLTKQLSRGKATVVFIGSVASELDIPGELLYSTTKAAISKLNSGFSSELTRLGIKYFEVRPGICKTPMTENLNEKSIDYMISKTAYNKMVSLDSVSETVLNTITLPITCSGSILYCGGIKR
tara:strand:+ start:1907 stop:2593 length:687 start_codon:yes stop_codon:yes gene_type:complete